MLAVILLASCSNNDAIMSSAAGTAFRISAKPKNAAVQTGYPVTAESENRMSIRFASFCILTIV